MLRTALILPLLIAALASLPAMAEIKYPSPIPLSQYRVIDLNRTTQETFNLSATDDVRFVGPSTPRRVGLRINGGRHIAITGGSFAPQKTWVTGGNNMTGTIATKAQTGSLWIEGVRIDNAGAFGSDAMTLNAGGTKYIPAYVQNTVAVNVQGKEQASLAPNLRAHADIIQPQGSLSALNIYNLQGSTDYQGLMVMKQDSVAYGGKVNVVNLEKVNLWHTRANDNCPYLLIIGGSSRQVVNLTDVTFTPPPNGRSCKGISVNTFPNAVVTGTVKYRNGTGLLW